MKSIKKKISTPFIAIIIIIPIVTMILFNLGMNIYVDKMTRTELINTVNGTVTMANQFMTSGLLEQEEMRDITKIGKKLKILRSASQVSKLSLNTELLLLSQKGDVLFPQSFEETFLNDKIVAEAKESIKSVQENTVIEFKVGNEKFMAASKNIPLLNKKLHLIFISSANSAKGIIQNINLCLLVILFLATFVAIIMASLVAKSISKPIIKLSGYVKQIGAGEFITLPSDDSSIEIYELTNSMNDMSLQLKKYDNSQRSFLQNASHELRTPLMSIQGYAEGIVKDIFKDTHGTAEIIVEESKRLSSLVEELLTLSRIENNSYKGEFFTANLSEIIKDYVQRIAGYATKENKLLNLEIRNENIAVNIDDNLLMQAVINVISNCIKYAKTSVNVCTLKQDNYAVIRISDDGKGILDIELSKIFERFYKGKHGNNGLGLSIAKTAIEYMGGSISAYNQDGAVFEIKLPLK